MRPTLESLRKKGTVPSLVAARFVSRPNRFVVRAELPGGRCVRAHLADPGRLRELLVPRAELRLRRARGSSRKTRYTVALVRSSMGSRAWVSVDTTFPNCLAEGLVLAGRVGGLGRGWAVRREVRLGRSRFDFLLTKPGSADVLLEVKSVTLVVDGVARFPDAPTARGTRHLRELEAHVLAGGRAMVLFVVQREDARAVAPNPATDPGFARALASAARAGVVLRAGRFHLSERGEATWMGPLPVRGGLSS